MDIRKVKKLIELIEESGVSEIDKRRRGIGRVTRDSLPRTNPEPMGSTQSVIVDKVPDSVPETNSVDSADDGNIVKSPMVGTFYAALS